jgi:hypothetical protein
MSVKAGLEIKTSEIKRNIDLAFGFLVPEFKKKLCGSDFQR